MKELAWQDQALPETQALARACPDPPALDAYLRRHWRIVPDPEEFEFVQSPNVQFDLASQNGFFSGDCDDAATLAACVMCALSWPCSLFAGREGGKFEFGHTWLGCYCGNGVYEVDPIVPAEHLPVAHAFEELLEIPVVEGIYAAPSIGPGMVRIFA
jgi:hypothetical protein